MGAHALFCAYVCFVHEAPGPDGFPFEWYKAFKAELTPVLLQAYNTTLVEGKKAPSLNEAIIYSHRGKKQNRM